MRIACLTFLIAAQVSAGEITLCPGPNERYRSPYYQVTVERAGPVFVYYCANAWKQVPDKQGGNWEYQCMSADNSWISLSARSNIAFTIRATDIVVEQAELLPQRPGNAIAIAKDGTVRATLKLADNQADYYFVRINGDHGNKHPLFIFVDAPEKQAPRKGPNVHFFGPGYTTSARITA